MGAPGEAVNHEDDPPLRRWDVLCALVVFILSCGMFLISARLISRPPAWATFEFCQYAEIGRNLARDGAFETNLVEPMALAYLDTHREGPTQAKWPIINRYPLPCAAVAGLMCLLGPTAMAAACSNGLAISLLASLTYLLARRWYGPGWGAIAGLLFLANPSFYGHFVLLGTPDPWFALTFNVELLVFAQAVVSPNARTDRAMLLGVLAGLAYLARFNVVLFLAIQGVALLGMRRWRETLVMIATGLAIATPLFVYNVGHLHRPMVSLYSAWNLLDDIGAYRVEPWLYYEVPDLASQLAAHRSGLLHKFATNLFSIVPWRIWSLWHWLVLLPLAFVAPVVVRLRPLPRRFLVTAMGLFLLQLVVFSALRLELEDRLSPHHGRYFFWFAPPALLLAVGMLRHASGTSMWRRALIGAVVVAQLALYGSTWKAWILESTVRSNFGDDPIRRVLAKVIPADRVVASNQPQILTWHSGLKTISMPADPDELERLNQHSPTPADFLFLDLNYNAIDLDPRWAELVQPTPGRFSPWEYRVLKDYEYVFPPARTRPILYVLLRRRSVPPSRREREIRASMER
jgi:hypothetical protein